MDNIAMSALTQNILCQPFRERVWHRAAGVVAAPAHHMKSRPAMLGSLAAVSARPTHR